MQQEKSQPISRKDLSENFNQFYRLHYPPKKQSERDPNHFRAKSVISVTERPNPQDTPNHLGKRKHSHLDKVNPEFMKPKIQQSKKVVFSFKKALAGEQEQKTLEQYFSKLPPRYFGTLEDISKRNTGVRSALQRCKDEKLKVGKVLSSQRQSEQTKKDYLHLKRKELEEEKGLQARQIYDQFFRKEYEPLFGDKAFEEFSSKLERVVSILHGNLFGNRF